MKKSAFLFLIFYACAYSTDGGFFSSYNVVLHIKPLKILKNEKYETIITIENLVSIREYILNKGLKEETDKQKTYFQNLPCFIFETDNYYFYLTYSSNKDEINDELNKIDFDNLLIVSKDSNGLCPKINFSKSYDITIEIIKPSLRLTVMDIRSSASEPIKEVLNKINLSNE